VDEKERRSERNETRCKVSVERDKLVRGRGNRARGALETELCVLLNAEHKLPVFCFCETMRGLTQGRGRVTGGPQSGLFFLLRLV